MANERWRCMSCGVEANCDCNAGYRPAGEYAAKVVKENPNLSVRAIAKKYNLARMTVQRAHIAARTAGVPNGTPAKPRTGLDGKSYPAQQPKQPVRKPMVEEKPARREVTTRLPSLERRIAKLERTYKRILEIRKRGTIPREFYRRVRAFLHHPQNVSEAKLHQLREEWEMYGWLMASEATLPTPSLTDVGISVKEKVE